MNVEQDYEAAVEALQQSMTLSERIEALCNAFGWCCEYKPEDEVKMREELRRCYAEMHSLCDEVRKLEDRESFAQVGELVMDMYDWCQTGRTPPFKRFLEQVKS